MNPLIDGALTAVIQYYAPENSQQAEDFLSLITDVLIAETTFLDKVDRLDELVDSHTEFEELREVFFDLLLINFFSVDVTRLEADYLESEAWLRIEDETIDRGTELLNLLLYLQESIDEGLEVSLDDYLKEFLLVDEDGFQDEHRIYESMIAQPVLADSSYEEIGKAARRLEEDDELVDLFYPIMSFFYEMEPNEDDMNEFLQSAPNEDFDLAVYQLIVNFNK